MNGQAPGLFRVRLDTSKGPVVVEVHRDWAPRGADRFYNLVRAGYYDDSYFFRIKAGYWVQFGINGDPQVSNAWRGQTFADDPRRESNVRGTIAFAFAVPNGRTTQVFINLRDNSATHDGEPFVPFGKVIEGMGVVDALNAEYGETAGGGIRGGKQGPLFEQGNSYLKRNFPRLDRIRSARIIVAAGLRACSRAGAFSPADGVMDFSARLEPVTWLRAAGCAPSTAARMVAAAVMFPLATRCDLAPILTLQPLLTNKTKQLV